MAIAIALKKKSARIKELKSINNLLERKIKENLEKLTTVCEIKEPSKMQSRDCQVIMENDNKVRNIDTESLKKMKINFKIVNIKPKIRELEKIVPEKEVIRSQYYDSIYLQKFWILET